MASQVPANAAAPPPDEGLFSHVLASSSALHASLVTLASRLDGRKSAEMEARLAKQAEELEAARREALKKDADIAKKTALITRLQAAVAALSGERDEGGEGGGGGGGGGDSGAAGALGSSAAASLGAAKRRGEAGDAGAGAASQQRASPSGADGAAEGGGSSKRTRIDAGGGSTAAATSSSGSSSGAGGLAACLSPPAAPAERAAERAWRCLEVVKWEPTFGVLGKDLPPASADRLAVSAEAPLVLGRGKFGIIDPKISREQVSLSLERGQVMLRIQGINGTHLIKASDPSRTLVRCSKDDDARVVGHGDVICFTVSGAPPAPKDNILVIVGAM